MFSLCRQLLPASVLDWPFVFGGTGGTREDGHADNAFALRYQWRGAKNRVRRVGFRRVAPITVRCCCGRGLGPLAVRTYAVRVVFLNGSVNYNERAKGTAVVSAVADHTLRPCVYGGEAMSGCRPKNFFFGRSRTMNLTTLRNRSSCSWFGLVG